MEWWHKMVFPVRRAWFSLSTRLKSHRQNGEGILKLHDDIQTCGYEDVQIMWEMLRQTESEIMTKNSKRRLRWSWKNLTCSNPDAASAATPFATNNAE